jgi:hypothetical protein
MLEFSSRPTFEGPSLLPYSQLINPDDGNGISQIDLADHLSECVQNVGFSGRLTVWVILILSSIYAKMFNLHLSCIVFLNS